MKTNPCAAYLAAGSSGTIPVNTTDDTVNVGFVVYEERESIITRIPDFDETPAFEIEFPDPSVAIILLLSDLYRFSVKLSSAVRKIFYRRCFMKLKTYSNLRFKRR